MLRAPWCYRRIPSLEDHWVKGATKSCLHHSQDCPSSLTKLAGKKKCDAHMIHKRQGACREPPWTFVENWIMQMRYQQSYGTCLLITPQWRIWQKLPTNSAIHRYEASSGGHQEAPETHSSGRNKNIPRTYIILWQHQPTQCKLTPHSDKNTAPNVANTRTLWNASPLPDQLWIRSLEAEEWEQWSFPWMITLMISAAEIFDGNLEVLTIFVRVKNWKSHFKNFFNMLGMQIKKTILKPRKINPAPFFLGERDGVS